MKKLLISIGIIALAALAGFGGHQLVINHNHQVATQKAAQAAKPTQKSIVFTYPAGWTDALYSQNDQASGVIARLGRSSPDASLLVRQNAISPIAPSKLSQAAKDTINLLQTQVDNFKLVSSSVTKIDGTNAIEIKYDQISATSNLMVILPAKAQAYYLVYSTTTGNIGSIQPDITKLNHNFIAYLKAQKLL